MAQKNNSTKQLNSKSVILRMLTGAAIGFALISVFVFSENNPNPDWGKFWRVRPLIVTPLFASFGILSFYLKNYLRPKGQFMTVLVFLFSTLVFLFVLWFGTVMGLDGTLWD